MLLELIANNNVFKMRPQISSTLLLLLLSITSCMCSSILFGANYTPIVGTVYAELVGTNNKFTATCDQFCQDTAGNVAQTTTSWSMENFMHFTNLVSISESIHPEYFINGTDRGTSLPFPTFRNILTIVNLTQRLHNVRLYCGQSSRSRDAYWDIRVYTRPELNTNVQVTLVEGMPLSIDLSENKLPAFPYPRDFEWTKQGITTSNSSGVAYGYPSLIIDAVTRNDHGNYSLSAINSRLEDPQSIIGTGTGNFFLNVLYGPDIDEEESSFVAVEGTNVTLTCGTNLVGNPIPSIEWIDNEGEILDSTEGYVFNDGPAVVSLLILSTMVTDSGNWTCRLNVSETGRILAVNLTLTVIDPPSEPLNVTIEDTGSTWTSISWEPPINPGSPNFSNFTITATPSIGGVPVSATVGRVFNVNLTGLSPGIVYRVSVIAMNGLGGTYANSNNSIEAVTTTNTTVPEVICPNRPVSSNGVITVRWDYRHLGGLNLTSVVVDYATPDQDISNFLTLENSEIPSQNISQQTSLEVSGFVAGIFYTFRITASNDLGTRSILCPSVLHSTGTPQQPSILSAESNMPQQVVLTVRAVEPGTETSDLSFKFVVQVERENSSSSQFKVVIPYSGYQGEAVEITVDTGLSEGDRYSFRVSARNQFGMTPFSDSIVLQIMETLTQQLPISAIAGGAAGGLVVVILLVLLIVVVLFLVLKKQKDPQHKTERSDSLEMIANANYGKTKVFIDGDAGVEPIEYETVPVDISRPGSQKSVYDQLAPPTTKESDNPLYSSTGELRMSAVYNTYDAIPGTTARSREQSRNTSPINVRAYSISQSPLPPRPKSHNVSNSNGSIDLLYSVPSHDRTSSFPTYSSPAAARKSISSPPEGHLVDREHLYSHAKSPPGSRQGQNQDPVYTEL